MSVHWKSFELDPFREKQPKGTVYELLANKYGHDVAWAKQASAHTALRAKQVGLNFDFDRVIPANTLDAHRLIHLADKHGLQSQMKERFMAAYFTEGQNINDASTLQKLAVEVGLEKSEVKKTLDSDEFAIEVRRDEQAAMKLGVTGVPFFLFNREVPISGAQPADVFLSTLQTVFDGR